MMMKVAVNRKKEEEGEMRNVEERTTRRQGKRKGTRARRGSLRSSEPAVCRCDRLRLSRVLQTRALPQPHTLGHITRRDLYSRLTSPCEGRICSVRIRHSCIRARFDCMSVCLFFSVPLLPFLPSYSLTLVPLSNSVRSSGRAFAATTCTRPYRHFRHPRDSTRAQLDGSNWTANDRTVIRTNNPSFLLALYSRNPRPSIYDDTLRDTFLRKLG